MHRTLTNLREGLNHSTWALHPAERSSLRSLFHAVVDSRTLANGCKQAIRPTWIHVQDKTWPYLFCLCYLSLTPDPPRNDCSKSVQSWPKAGPESVKSQLKVGPKLAQCLHKVDQKSAQSRPKVDAKSAKSPRKVSPKSTKSRPNTAVMSAQSRRKVSPKSVQSGSKVGSKSHV